MQACIMFTIFTFYNVFPHIQTPSIGITWWPQLQKTSKPTRKISYLPLQTKKTSKQTSNFSDSQRRVVMLPWGYGRWGTSGTP